MTPAITLLPKPSFGNSSGIAPCKTCGDDLEILQGKAAPYILPIGVRPGTMHAEFYDNIEDHPVIDKSDEYLCICRDPTTHIHCLPCMTKIIWNYTDLQMDMSTTTHPELRPEPMDWQALVTGIRNAMPERVESTISTPSPCICYEMCNSVFLAGDYSDEIVSYLENAPPKPSKCIHREASIGNRRSNPDILPRSMARGYIHDESEGRQMGLVYEQIIGPSVVCRVQGTPILIKDQNDLVQCLTMDNYSSTNAKGYTAWDTEQEVLAISPSTKFHQRFGSDGVCHAVCTLAGRRSAIEFSGCRLIESGVLLWMADIGIMNSSCCGKCDVGILLLALSIAIDTADRFRDSAVGEIYNINGFMGRQHKLALEVWKSFVIHGADRGFCCERSRNMYRCIRNVYIWTSGSPAYYTHALGQREGVLGFVEAINQHFMRAARRSQDGCEDISKEGPALIDDVMQRIIETRLIDFLIYFAA
ncbi:hypothetical protein TWF718_007912 [Orbilia javanica]|uniref:Uncharacterized protein n=1 Tax=Orbilia javanica TaxID=47235 RepID=A0AAN8RML7_9PEZI